MSKPKPKSVDEAWCIERINSKGNLFYLQVEYTKRHAEESLRIQGRNSAVTYRIRKWKAVTVCEWKRISLFSSNDGLQVGCNGKKLWAGQVDLDMHCYCGGKIRVRK